MANLSPNISTIILQETKLIELNKEIKKSIVIPGDFNAPLSTTDRMARQKIIDIEELHTINR